MLNVCFQIHLLLLGFTYWVDWYVRFSPSLEEGGSIGSYSLYIYLYNHSDIYGPLQSSHRAIMVYDMAEDDDNLIIILNWMNTMTMMVMMISLLPPIMGHPTDRAWKFMDRVRRLRIKIRRMLKTNWTRIGQTNGPLLVNDKK